MNRLLITYVEGSIEGTDGHGKPIGSAGVEDGWYVIRLAPGGTLDITTMDGPHESAGDAGVRLIDIEEVEG